MAKTSKYDNEGHVSNLEVWDWVKTKDGRTVQITHDDMTDLHYSEISRHATNDEIDKQLNAIYGDSIYPINVNP